MAQILEIENCPVVFVVDDILCFFICIFRSCVARFLWFLLIPSKAAEHQQQRGKYKHRMERMESKLIRQHDRLEDLEVGNAGRRWE